MTKRPFLLLEILIAFTLVAICLVPLITQPLKLYRTEIEFLEELERERLADWTFTEVKEKLLKREIPWEKIPPKNSISGPFTLPPSSIEIPGSKPKKIDRKYSIACRGEKKGTEGQIYRSMRIIIEFFPKFTEKKKNKTYTFRLSIKQLPAESPPKENVEEKTESLHRE